MAAASWASFSSSSGVFSCYSFSLDFISLTAVLVRNVGAVLFSSVVSFDFDILLLGEGCEEVLLAALEPALLSPAAT